MYHWHFHINCKNIATRTNNYVILCRDIIVHNSFGGLFLNLIDHLWQTIASKGPERNNCFFDHQNATRKSFQLINSEEYPLKGHFFHFVMLYTDVLILCKGREYYDDFMIKNISNKMQAHSCLPFDRQYLTHQCIPTRHSSEL